MHTNSSHESINFTPPIPVFSFVFFPLNIKSVGYWRVYLFVFPATYITLPTSIALFLFFSFFSAVQKYKVRW